MSNILKNVDILDLVTINVYKGRPMPGDPNPIQVTVDPLDQSKKLEWDTDALNTLNTRLTEKLVNSDITNPNTVQYIKEFVGRMLSELYRNGLVIISDIPDSPEDPYAEAKRQFKNTRFS